jgi:hypothetical protein
MADKVPPLAPPLGTPDLRAMLPDLLIDAALPAIAYQILSRHGAADVPALTAGAIFPAAENSSRRAASISSARSCWCSSRLARSAL